jgi:hypothetical protein
LQKRAFIIQDPGCFGRGIKIGQSGSQFDVRRRRRRKNKK